MLLTLCRRILRSVCVVLMALGAAAAAAETPRPEGVPPTPATPAAGNSWEPGGWGGGGWYWSAAFHPTRDGVIYLGQDVGGVSKTTDHGMTWRMINNGLTDYGVYSLAVDPSRPDTVYAATEGGLHKSTDAGEHWQLLPNTGKKGLRITGERSRSVRAIAVDPVNGDNLYAASPGGKVYKSGDGGQTWTVAYEKKASAENLDILRVQFGKVNGEYFGGVWLPLAFPAGAKPEDTVGVGFSFKGEKVLQDKWFVTLKTASGVSWQSRNLADLLQNDQWQDVVLKAGDFVLDPGYAKKNPEAAKSLADGGPKWAEVNRLDFSGNGAMTGAVNVAFGKFFFAFKGTDEAKPDLVTARDFKKDKVIQGYGNFRIGAAPQAKAVYAVAVAAKDPTLVVAATEDAGLVLSEDAGKTWRELDTPKKATSAVFADTDPNILFGAFDKEGIWKSTDKGRTWARSSEGIPASPGLIEVAVSPANPLNVYAVGDGAACLSNDGGLTWKKCPPTKVDLEGNPTRHYGGENPTQTIARAKNITINPRNPKELYIAADWRSSWSGDGGLTWEERERGSDISCNTDIRFSKGRVYTSAMDEGALVSENNGRTWRQLWPLKYIAAESGHCWRVAVNTVDGVDHIVTAFSPWDSKPRTNVIIVSDDGGKTHQLVQNGLPDYLPKKNVNWEAGFIRALAADPADPRVFYAGIDGDPEPGKSGGGIFKSEDAGHTWKQLPNQPGSRRVFYGLAVDPTDSKRIFWGTCGTNGGVWMTADGGVTWNHIFTKDAWVRNLHVSKDGIVYAAGANLWRSSDHGKSWTQLTKFTDGRSIMGLETDPRDAGTVWISTVTWGGEMISSCGIFKTANGGATWQDITGNIPCHAVQILRFNPETSELWAGWVGLYKIKQ